MAEQISCAVQILQLSTTGFMKDALNEVNGIYAIATLLTEEPIPQLLHALKDDATQLQKYHDRIARALLSNRCIERLADECHLSTTLDRVLALPSERDKEIFDLLISAVKEATSAIDSDASCEPRLKRQAKIIIDITHTLQRLVGTDPGCHTTQSRYGELDLVYEGT